jgi:hypothetical protein
MSLHDRAAQFSPFAALTGHEAAIEETARLTDQKMELEEDAKEKLDRVLVELLHHLKERPFIHISFFKQDEQKDGGEYLSVTELVCKINLYERLLVLEDKTEIEFDDIIHIQMQ